MFGLFGKKNKEVLDQGLEKSKKSVLSKIGRLIGGKSRVDQDLLDELESTLIESDVGVDTSIKIIENIEQLAKENRFVNAEELNQLIYKAADQLFSQSEDGEQPFDFNLTHAPKPYVIMVVGVNGVGKTTTIGKMAHAYKKAGKQVMLGAADTFRAAAVDQLIIWGDRVGVPVVNQGMGADPASVAFDAVSSASAKDMDVVIIDTAGRLHNKSNLMNELSKIKRVMQKVIPDAPHEILLVLDASTGQNAIEQAKQFVQTTDVNALALTKLDGTAKGGVVIGISDQFNIPVKYIGLGEGIDDLQLFNRTEFIKSLFGIAELPG
ncbi:MAG: signal recognition particle-docking protein FtsY [Vicingaceae bacterium]